MASVIDGRLVVAAAGTRVQIPQAGMTVRSIAVQALSANTGVVCVGAATVVAAVATRRGIALTAGQTVSIDTDDAGDVWVDAMVNGEGVTYIATVT